MKYRSIDTGLSLEIDDTLLSELHSVGLKHYPNEFGGVLIGFYSDDLKNCIVKASILPLKYKSARYSFERGREGLKEKLDAHYNARPRLIYIGEWHTHPDGLPLPSAQDKNAMKEIELSKEVNITSPILLIISLDKHQFTPKFYIQHNQKLYNYEQEK